WDRQVIREVDGGSAQPARPQVPMRELISGKDVYLPALPTEAMMVDHTAEIATLRQKLAAAEARTQGMGRHNATEADKDNIKLLTSRKSDKAKCNLTFDETKSTPTLDDLSERMAALLRDLNAVRERMATLLRDLSKDPQATT